MSRVGKNPIALPAGVEVTLNGRDLSVKGKQGQLSWTIPHEVELAQDEKSLTFSPRQQTKAAQALWGLSRALVANMVIGVSEGFERKLQILGVGYRAAVQGRMLNLSVGYSHPVNMEMPEGITATVNDNTEIVIKGTDKQAVGQFAANIRRVRAPEPYKGKGIRYAGERVILKEGKKK